MARPILSKKKRSQGPKPANNKQSSLGIKPKDLIYTPREQREAAERAAAIARSSEKIVWGGKDVTDAMQKKKEEQAIIPKPAVVPRQTSQFSIEDPQDKPPMYTEPPVQSETDGPNVDGVLPILEKVRQFFKKRSMRTIFRSMDVDKSNKIDKSELETMMGRLGFALKATELDQIWGYVARNEGQTEVSYHEVCQLLEVPKPTKDEKRRLAALSNPAVRQAMVKMRSVVPEVKSAGYRMLFNAFDVDGSGKLERDEFRKFLNMLHPKLTDEHAERITEAIDENKDGEIDYLEFSTNLENPNKPEHQILHGARITSGLLEAMGVRAAKHAAADHRPVFIKADYVGEVFRDHNPPGQPFGMVRRLENPTEWERKKKEYVHKTIHAIKQAADRAGGLDALYKKADYEKDDGITHGELKTLLEKENIEVGHDIYIQGVLEHLDLEYMNAVSLNSFKKVMSDPTLMLGATDVDKEIADIAEKMAAGQSPSKSTAGASVGSAAVGSPGASSVPAGNEMAPGMSATGLADLSLDLANMKDAPDVAAMSGAVTDRPSTRGTSRSGRRDRDSGPGALRRKANGLTLNMEAVHKDMPMALQTKVVIEQILHELPKDVPTRISARPPHKNTFVLTQFPEGSGGHATERERLVRYDLNTGCKVQIEDQAKKDQLDSARMRIIAHNEDRVNKYCMATQAMAEQHRLNKQYIKQVRENTWLQKVQNSIVVLKPGF